MEAGGVVIAAFLGGQEWLVVLLVILLFFGASRIPALARNLGSSIGEFKRGLKDAPVADVDPQVRDGQP